MKLKQEVINRLDNNAGYALVMTSLNVAYTTARGYVKDNSENLTKAAMLKALREEYDLADNEILEEESEVKEPAK